MPKDDEKPKTDPPEGEAAPETKTEEPKPEAASEKVEAVAEEVQDQTPPTNAVENGVDGFAKRLDKIEADLAGHTEWRNALTKEREEERAARRETLEHNQQEKKDDKTQGKQEPTKAAKPKYKRLKLFRGTRAAKK